MDHWLIYLVIGVGCGVLSATFGIGSGIVLVPLLVFAYAMPQKWAQGVALATMVPMVATGALRYWLNPAITVDLRMALFLSIGGIAGAFLGAWLAHVLPAAVLRKAFAVLMILAAVRMLMTPPPSVAATDGDAVEEGEGRG